MYSLNTTQWRAEDLNFIPYSKTDKENMNTGFLHLLRSLNTEQLGYQESDGICYRVYKVI